MNYTDEQNERIRHTFDSYYKKTICYQAISLYRENAKYKEHNRTIIFQSAASVIHTRFCNITLKSWGIIFNTSLSLPT